MAFDFGTVTGRILVTAGDSIDIGDTPDEVPVVGRIIFTPSVPYFVDTTNDVVVTAAEVVCPLDDEGRLTSPGDPTQKYAKLIASDSATINPKDWTYKVTFELAPGQGTLPNFNISVQAGQTVDLSSLVGVPSSTPVTVDQVTAVLAAAEAAAASAAASAAAATSAANASSARLLIYGTDTTSTSGPVVWVYVGATELPPVTGRPGPAAGDLMILGASL